MILSGTVQFFRVLFMYLKYLFRISDALSQILQIYCHFLVFSKQKERSDFHESVHRDTFMNVTNKMQLYRLIYYSWSALHVSGNIFANHQEHLTLR